MFCVATLGPGFTSQGEEPLRDQNGGLPGAPRAPGCGLQAMQGPVLRGGKPVRLHLQAPPRLGLGRGAERSRRKRKEGRGTQKDPLVGVQAEIPQEASCSPPAHPGPT